MILAALASPASVPLEYNRPQVSAHSGRVGVTSGTTEHFSTDSRNQMRLDYNRPQVSGHSGRTTLPESGVTPIDFDLETKAGSAAGGGMAGSNMSWAAPYSPESQHGTASGSGAKVYDVRPDQAYLVPANPPYRAQNELLSAEPHFRQKIDSLGSYNPGPRAGTHQASIPRAGISTPQLRLKGRKNLQ